MGKRLKPNEPSVISEAMDEELVVINLESGCYYNLNPSAARIWAWLERGATDEAIAAAQETREADPQEALETIASFCQYLEEEGLMIALPAGEDEVPLSPMAFEKPVIEKFSDMQEMLLLDPIHEVSEMGWPNEAEKP